MTSQDLAALYAAAFEATGSTATGAWSSAAFEGFLADPAVFLCVTGDGISGFVLGRAAGGEAEVLTLCVHPAARRGGLGHALVEAFLEESRRRGAEAAFLEVAENNLAARALYAAAGFRAQGRRKGYYARDGGAAVDALVLSRALTA
ncbi:MAG: GNAT family N-acetyltransferase [Pseudomonadota bacterium]